MVTLQLRLVPQGGDRYETGATLTVDDQGGHVLDDPQGLMPLDLPVLVPDETGGLRRVAFAEDPQIWVRNVHTVLRTGYLVPVVVEGEQEAGAVSADGGRLA